MLANVRLHSPSAALHCYLGSGSTAPVPITRIGHNRSVLAPGRATVGP